MSKITPFLWFNGQAEEAMNFYVSLFKNSKIIGVSRYGDGMPFPAGTVMTATFELDGQHITALNGGPQYKFSEAISFYVDCGSQAEVDDLWAKLTANGGQEGPCGWCKDKFGLSWQIVPSELGKLMGDPDPVKAGRVAQAMLKMQKLDVEGLRRAYRG
ncbi:MAG TPA: VOC family protein [Aggregatilineales bacterium]|nr:VOC family protein [Aggregatilineales bacterium]